MKKFINKNISVILSIVLVLGVFLPCFSGVKASAYTAENTQVKNQFDLACNNLIAEWKAMAGEEIPVGLEAMSPAELFEEASNVDLSDFENTSDFLNAKQGLATLLANSFDPTALKEAWSKINKLNATDFMYPFAATQVSAADAVYFREGVEGVTVNYTEDEKKHIFGEKTVTFDYTLGTSRTTASDTGKNDYTVFISNDAETSDSYNISARLQNVDEFQFAFVVNKINVAATGMKLGFRITGTYGGSFHVRHSNMYIDITEDMIDKVNIVKFSELAEAASMPDWQAAYGTGGATIARIEVQLCDTDASKNAAVNITFGTAVSTDLPILPSDEETASWTVSDWIYAAEGVDLTGYFNTEDFVAALNSAREIREISGIEMKKSVETTTSLGSANFSSYGDNLLSGLTPVVNYYDGVSEGKEEKFSTDFKGLADGKLTTSITVDKVDFSASGSFVEFIYDLEKTNAVEKVAVASSATTALRNYKYKLYAAKSEGELFTEDSLLTTYINRDGSAVQIYDYTSSPEIVARYFAIRIYIPATDMVSFDNTVRLNELGVWGRVKNYAVDAGPFSSEKIEELGINLLKDVSVAPYVRANTGNRQRFTGLFDSAKYPLDYVLDGDIDTVVGVGGNYQMLKAGDTTSLHIYFDLGKVYTIDKFLFSSANITCGEIGKYKIHASNDLNKLFTDKSVIAEHDNVTETTTMQIFNMKTGVVARYISFHITLAVSDYEGLIAKHGKFTGVTGIRIAELGVFGEEYQRPSDKTNLLTHVPVEVNRVDANGNKTAVTKTEYSGKNHALTYDGDYDVAAPIETNGNKIEYLYNIYNASTLDSIRVVTKSSNVTEMKFYAYTIESAMDNQSSLVYSYNSAVDGKETVFSKTFVEAPFKASFVKIVVTTSGESFDPTEIEAIGWDQGKPQYQNLVLNKAAWASYYIQDINTKAYSGVTEHMDKWLPAWSTWEDYQNSTLAFDGDLGTVYTYYGGANNSQSVNIYISLQTVSCVDNISVYTSLLEDYRPSKMNVYVGNSRDELFAAEATPIMQWTEKVLDETVDIEDKEPEESEGEDIFDGGNNDDDDIIIDFETGESNSPSGGESTEEEISEIVANYGLYEADFTAREITCVRLEIVESAPNYFAHTGKVGGIITELQVNGFEVAKNAAENVIRTAEEMSMRAFDPTTYQDFVAGESVTKKPIAMGSLNGEPIVTVKGIGDNVAHSACTPGYGYVEFSSTSDMTGDVTLADIEDIYFSYKVEKAYSSGEAVARIYIFDAAGKYANTFASTGTGTVLYIPTDNTQWVNTSMSAVTGDNWKDALTASFNTAYGYSGDESLTMSDISISKIRFGFNKSAQADITFSSMYYEFNDGCNPYANAITENNGKNGHVSTLDLSYYFKSDNTKVTAETVKEDNADAYTVVDGIGDTVGAGSCNAYSGALVYEVTEDGEDVTLADIENIYFSYKVNKAYSGESAVARIYIYDQDGKVAHTFANEGGTSTVLYLPLSNDKWTQTSIRKAAGENWKSTLLEAYNTDYGVVKRPEDITISKIVLGFNKSGVADMSFGQMYYEYVEDTNSSGDKATLIALLNNARNMIDVTTAKKADATEYKYSVQILADFLGFENTEAKYLSGDYKKTTSTMKELALLAQYLDGTLSADDYIDVNCADVNKDGVISEADVTALRKQLLGIK